MVKTATPGRGFAKFSSKREERAFALWMNELVTINGGRKAVVELTGLSPDNLSKWASGRAIPSTKSLEKLISYGVIPYPNINELLLSSPWTQDSYLQTAGDLLKPARNQEIAEPAPEPAPLRWQRLPSSMTEQVRSDMASSSSTAWCSTPRSSSSWGSHSIY